MGIGCKDMGGTTMTEHDFKPRTVTLPSVVLKLTLPIPSKLLSPNARAHYIPKAKAVKAGRELACLVATRCLLDAEMKQPRWSAAFYSVSFFTETARKQDDDNLLGRLKATRDGFADAGIVEDDYAFKLAGYPACKVAKDAKNPRVEIVIWEVEA
jgi:hypothetical protein